MKYNCVVWDWNGTLLNDVDICIEAMNMLLKKYELTSLDAERYRKIFGFPVRDYYERLGFDFGDIPFERPAMEFIELYYGIAEKAGLSEGAEEALKRLSCCGVRQLVLSASEQGSLAAQIRRFGIERYFSDILGIDNHFAAGKAALAAQWISENNIDKGSTVFIGDTLHDYEVASAVGCDCILVASGHQNRDVLSAAANNIAEDISAAVELICSAQ